MTFIGSHEFETNAEEAARLAKSPIGSRNRALAALPVRVPVIKADTLIELPGLDDTGKKVIVSVIAKKGHTSGYNCTAHKKHTHTGVWEVAPLYSTDDKIVIPNHRLVLHESQLVRGREINLDELLAIA